MFAGALATPLRRSLVEHLITKYWNHIVWIKTWFCSCANSVFWKKIRINYHLDTERKWNILKTFKRRPGRFLNVLCTFNLHSVSMGWLVFNFWHPCPPCSSSFILHIHFSTCVRFSKFLPSQKTFRDVYEFSNEKSESEKRENDYFL